MVDTRSTLGRASGDSTLSGTKIRTNLFSWSVCYIKCLLKTPARTPFCSPQIRSFLDSIPVTYLNDSRQVKMGLESSVLRLP